MPHNVASGKPSPHAVYEQEGIRTVRAYRRWFGLAAIMVCFFYLVRSIQLGRQSTLVWLVLTASIYIDLTRRRVVRLRYQITDQEIRALDHVTDRTLWRVAISDISDVRVAGKTVVIRIPKKFYVVYTGAASPLFAERIRANRSFRIRSYETD